MKSVQPEFLSEMIASYLGPQYSKKYKAPAPSKVRADKVFEYITEMIHKRPPYKRRPSSSGSSGSRGSRRRANAFDELD